MNEKPEVAPLHDSLRDMIGQAISDEIAAGAEQPDWCDSREIDRLADAVLAVLPAAQACATVAGPEQTAVDTAFAAFCDRQGYPIDGEVNTAIRDAFDEAVSMFGRAAQPSTAQQERAWYKEWLASVDGNITVDQIEFGRRVWAERARRAAESGA